MSYKTYYVYFVLAGLLFLFSCFSVKNEEKKSYEIEQFEALSADRKMCELAKGDFKVTVKQGCAGSFYQWTCIAKTDNE